MVGRTLRFDDAPDVLTVDQAAELLGLGRTTAYNAFRTGVLPAIHVGRRVMVFKQSLVERLKAGDAGARAERA